MSEFKGTKGKWFLEYYKTDDELVARTTEEWVCLINQFKNEKHKHNALLISKAPEMLDMLKKVLEVNKHHNFNGHLINEQIEQLIKQATEI